MAPLAIKILLTIIIVGTCEQGPRSRSPRLGQATIRYVWSVWWTLVMPPMTHLMTHKYLLELLYCLESTTFGHSSFTTVVQIQLSTSTSSSLAFAVLSTSMEQRGIIHYTLSFVQSRAYVTFCSICQPLIPELWRDLHQHSSPVQMAISQRQAHTYRPSPQAVATTSSFHIKIISSLVHYYLL